MPESHEGRWGAALWSRRRRWLHEYGITAGTLGSTSSQTVMVVLLPVLLARYTSSHVMIGFAVGGEGLFALLVPYWIGTLSDRLPARYAERFGRRAFFLILAAPLMALAVASAPFFHGYWPIAAVALIFFAALHAFLTPLWALMVDAVPDERRGSVQGMRGVLHAAGLGYAMVGGGLLFALWAPLPFLLAGLMVLVTTAMTVLAAPAHTRGVRMEHGPGASLGRLLRELKEEGGIRWFLIATALWNGAIDGIRPYFFLFATAVIGVTIAEASLVLGILVAGLAIGSFALGRLGDRLGKARVLGVASVVMGLAMGAGYFVRNLPSAVVLMILAGIGAASMISLPYPLFSSFIGSRATGRYTGLYVQSIGLGRIVAPVVVGAVIDRGARYLPEAGGYPFMWPVAGLLTIAGALSLRQAIRHGRAGGEGASQPGV